MVIDNHGKLIISNLDHATNDILSRESCPLLEHKCNQVLNYEQCFDGNESKQNKEVVEYVLENTERDLDGRLVMPLIWNSKVCHLLGQNFNLAKQILNANLRKLKKDQERLIVIDNVIREQISLGVVEQITDINGFLAEHPQCAFLAHMPVFRINKETTKCRVVYLSNLAGRDADKAVTLSNNQCMLAGPCLNTKISTSLIQLRFDKYLLCFDLVKAFLQIALKEEDQNRLCFLWVRNPSANDFTVVAYKNTKLSFGLKCSPTLLMLALYKILVVDAVNDSVELAYLKRCLYNNFYMDNGACGSNDENYLEWAYE